ncbi:MAG: ATP-dependent DNA helicase [Candidatus Hatepunaea meridiana]|nr:ATP-dependent DNA helicase [Candidatus Hatepunaea meridiana]
MTPKPDWDSIPLPLHFKSGQQAHTEFAKNHPLGLTEYYVKGEYHARNGRKLNLNGRIDVLEKLNGKHKILELKSILLPVGNTSPDVSELPARFTLQVQIYAYLYQLHLPPEKGHPDEVECYVVIQNLSDDSLDTYNVHWSVEDVETELDRYAEICETEEKETQATIERRQRMADRLQWTFSGYRTGQEDIIDAVEQTFKDGGDILIEAPTGIGKTMAVLYPALKHSLKSGGQLFFATAKSSGRKAVMNALRSLSSNRVSLLTLVRPPRDALCLNDPANCNPLECKLFDSYYQEDKDVVLPDELMKPDIVTARKLKDVGQTAGICPVVLARKLTLKADIVIGDYNFVFSPMARLSQFRDKPKSNWVLLLDEAHNLFDRVREELSAELSYETIIHCRDLLQEILWLYADDPSAGELMVGLGALVALFERCLEELPPEGVAEIELEAHEWERLYERIGITMSKFMAATAGRLDTDLNKALWELFTSLKFFTDILQRDSETYIYYGNRAKGVIGLYCLNPRDEMRQMYNHFTNVAAFSGTLSPADFYREALGFGVRPLAQIETSGWFDGKRRMVLLSSDVNTRFHHRPREAPRIASIIKRFVKQRNGGYLAVLPSFEFLDLVAMQFDESDIDVRLQTRRMNLEERRKVRAALERPDKITLALVVAGGQFTESEDYPGDACIGVVIVGPCLPRRDPWREALREYWERRGEDGYGVAYLYPGIRRVVQAGGRLFRHENDRGIILLIGERFKDMTINRLLPQDWRESINTNSENWYERVVEFWNE